jgi:hypothetical protein
MHARRSAKNKTLRFFVIFSEEGKFKRTSPLIRPSHTHHPSPNFFTTSLFLSIHYIKAAGK